MQYSTSHAVYYICSKLYACSSRLIFGVYMKHYKHYLVQVQDTFPLKVYGPNNCMVLGPLPPHPHIPNPFCALLAGWGLAGSGQQSRLCRDCDQALISNALCALIPSIVTAAR